MSRKTLKILYIPIGLITYPYTMYHNRHVLRRGSSNRYPCGAIGLIAFWPLAVPLTYYNMLEGLIEKYC